VSTLVVTAVDVEAAAVIRDLGEATAVRVGPYDAVRLQSAAGTVDVVAGGVGPAAAAAATATALAVGSYDTVISAGIAGGFSGRARVGAVVVADTITAADLGCRVETGFLALRDLGLDYEHRLGLPGATAWRERLFRGGLTTVGGEVLTLSSMTGTDERAEELSRLHPYATAEAMEGWGVVTAAQHHPEVRVGEVRAISNLVGRRDPKTWDVPRAFEMLAHAFDVLLRSALP
jgi:futalosine hydrolase